MAKWIKAKLESEVLQNKMIMEIAIDINSKRNCTCILSISKPTCFELLAIKLVFVNGPDIIVVGCYRPPSAASEAITSLTDLLHNWTKSELILLGDLNWDWLSQMSDPLKGICDSLCLDQLINLPTWLNHKDLVKSYLYDNTTLSTRTKRDCEGNQVRH